MYLLNRMQKYKIFFVRRKVFRFYCFLAPFLFVSLRKKPYFCIVIELERHIEILLLNNDCVIVPGLGGFMAHYVEARFSEEDGLFLPPLRTLGFNPQLQLNDHLLVQSYIEAYDISYPEALRRVEDEVTELRQHLETEGQYELNDIGTLSLNEEGKLEFEPCEAGILTPDLYGLSTFEMPTVNQIIRQAAKEKEEEVVIKQTSDEVQQPAVETQLSADLPIEEQEPAEDEKKSQDALVIPMAWVRGALAAAAAIIMFFMMTPPVSNSNIPSEVVQSSMIPTIGSKEVKKTSVPQQPAAKSQQPKANSQKPTSSSQQPAANDQHATSPKERYVIVLASQTTLSNARDFLYQLAKKGYDDTHIMEMNDNNKVRVTFGSYDSESDAHQKLHHLRSEDEVFQEAWILKTNK